ncbi:helix-turn-helix transcriptional regulator [Microcoleus sp. ARI1-B5]|uniref:helix-turn-helix domain-containing protein n=1 Tax=unclassified Microcoleus TaxID=2642155 RepID=UPI002FD16442
MQQRSQPLNPNLAHSFGTLLKQWRTGRGFSQLELSLASQVSQRHISFLESGRANPSQDMVLKLAAVLEVPLRQQNLMLTAAGFAPIHTETDLSAPEMTAIRKALDFMLLKQEPYPAFAIDRYWNLLLTNHAADRLLAAFIDLETLQSQFCPDGKVNLMRVMFHPQGLRPFVVNWEDFAGHLLRRVHQEAMSTSFSAIGEAAQNESVTANGHSEQSVALFNELMSYPGVSDIWQASNRVAQNTLLLTVHLKRDRLELQFFSTIATLGTSYDITLQ